MQAIRGKDQRGISFVRPEDWLSDDKVASISCQGRTVYTDIRTAQAVPLGHIVIDSKLYDSLSCSGKDGVEVIPESIAPSVCKTLTIEVQSLAGIGSRRVKEAVSERIRDFGPHLDDLLVTEGQQLNLQSLNLRLTVLGLSLFDSRGTIGRIRWPRLEKIELVGGETPDMCAFVILVEMSRIRGLQDEDDAAQSGAWASTPFSEILIRLLAGLRAFSASNPTNVVVSVIAYSSQTDIFLTYEPDSGQKRKWSEIDMEGYLEALQNWLADQKGIHDSQPSDPGLALQTGFAVVDEMRDDGLYPVCIALLSTGRYSIGQNPVSVVRRQPGNITTFSLGLESASDEDMLKAISEAGRGRAIMMSRITDMQLMVEDMIQMMGREVAADD